MSSFFVRPEEGSLYPGTVVVRPLEHDSSNVDVKLGQTVYTVVPPITPAKVKPVSINHEPWTAFGSVENRLFLDDFCHQKTITIKAQSTTYNGATIKIKENVQIEKDKPIKSKSEIKAWFPLFARMQSALHLRLTSTDARIHYDHGIEKIGGQQINIYGSFGFLRTYEKYNYKVGFTLLQRGLTVDTRLKLDNEKKLSIFHRTTGKIREFRFGAIAAADLTDKALTTKKFLLGYEKNNVDVSVKAEQEFSNKTQNYQDWKQWFNKYTLTAVFKRNSKQRYGLQVTHAPKKDQTVATALVEYKHNDKSLTKLTFDSNLNLAVLIKLTLTKKLAFSFGTLFPVKKLEKKADNKYGIQLDLNI